jgi:CBS domain-containing protein
MNRELVKDWMSRNVVTVSPNTTLPEAHQAMKTNGFRRLPVVDKHGDLIGILTLGDVRGAEASPASSLSVWELNYLLARLKVSSVMTTDPVTIGVDTTIGDAARKMLDTKVSGLPVMDDNGKLVGMITESDIFRMVVLNQWQQEPEPQ